MADHGIKMLLTICETRSNDANEEALLKATSARKNIAEQKHLRQALRDFEEIVRRDDLGEDGAVEITADEVTEIQGLLRSAGLYAGDVRFEGAGVLGVADGEKRNSDKAELCRNRFQDAVKDLEAADKIGNFEMQDLLSRSNQAETLKSAARKKIDETASALIGNVR